MNACTSAHLPVRRVLIAASIAIAVWVSVLATATVSLAAENSHVDDTTSPHLRMSLLVDGRANAERVGVLFDLEPGWHIYWKNPGDTGLAPELEWQAEPMGAEDSQRVRIGELEWPAPVPFEGSSSGIASYGYADQVLLANKVAGFDASRKYAVTGSVLICKDECIPVDFKLERGIGPDGWGEGKRDRALFDQTLKRVPQQPEALGIGLRAGYSRAALRPGDEFEAAIAIDGCKRPDLGCDNLVAAKFNTLFPDEATYEAMTLSALEFSRHPTLPNSSILRVRGSIESDADPVPTQLGGVLRLATGDGQERAIEVQVPFPALGLTDTAGSAEIAPGWMNTSPPSPSDGSQTATTTLSAMQWLRVLLLALLGGVILNGMPCVLPVLGIKICSAAELAQHDPSELRRHGFAYLAGVLASMAVLAGAVISLKAAGSSVGWGFQFQEPMFVAGVAAVVVLFALNLFGVFEIQFSTQRLSEVGAGTQGPTRSFFDGLLAVVLATPCTAPFLGTAVGFAFAGGAGLIVATFLAIGAGLAAPYTLICLIPGWSRYVPRAGAWMLRLRAGLGFLLLATAVWLVWIFGRTAGVDAQATLLAVLVALSFGVWLFGWVQTQARPTTTLATALALVVFGGAAMNTIEATPQTQAPLVGEERWAHYDATAIRDALAAGEPVFVSFTADWCITCKVNERGTLADPQVRDALDHHGYRWFRGDWTQRDEVIRAELARHGRAGVPLYLVYDPSDPDHPQVLPELLSVERVINAFERSAASGNKLGQTVDAQ